MVSQVTHRRQLNHSMLPFCRVTSFLGIAETRRLVRHRHVAPCSAAILAATTLAGKMPAVPVERNEIRRNSVNLFETFLVVHASRHWKVGCEGPNAPQTRLQADPLVHRTDRCHQLYQWLSEFPHAEGAVGRGHDPRRGPAFAQHHQRHLACHARRRPQSRL